MTANRRLEIQLALDSERTALQRNQLGQFATPPRLASEISRYAVSLKDAAAAFKVLEPSCGSGAFIEAAIAEAPAKLASITGVELDPRFARAATELWGSQARVIEADFMQWVAMQDELFDLLIANPPYVRHHHLTKEQKASYADICHRATGLRVSGLSGLYVMFILAAHKALAPGAVATWLVPSEFMTVNYGKALRTYLTQHVSLVRVHRFETSDAQFDDALVSSCVVTYVNRPPDPSDTVCFTGGSYSAPSERSVPLATLKAHEKWPIALAPVDGATSPELRLGALLQVRRGIATGDNKFFIRTLAEWKELGIPATYLRPVLPSPRNLSLSEVSSNADGWPELEGALGLLDCNVAEQEMRRSSPSLAALLDGASSRLRSGYLIKQRSPWYKQEQRPQTPIVCTYMGRSRTDRTSAFRFIRNHSNATLTNAYLGLYPTKLFDSLVTDKSEALDIVWRFLNQLPDQLLAVAGREYGGGLRKLEPKELEAIDAVPLLGQLQAAGKLTPDALNLVGSRQLDLWAS